MKSRACSSLLVAALASFLAAAPGAAQEILVGHVAGYTGPVAHDAGDMGAGAQVLFDSVNARGGVLGRKLRLVAADDKYNADDTVKLIDLMKGKVVALLPMTGSRNVGQVLKSGVLDKVALPIVGAVPGQDSVQAMLNKNMFHFRAGDRNQLEKIIEQLTTMGIKNIAALASTNPNGKEAVGIIEQTLEKRGLKLSVYAAYNVSDKSGFSQPVKQVVDLKPDAIILQGPPDMIATLTKELRARGVTALLYSLSYADFRLIAKVVGPDSARGVVISQVLPNLNNRALPLVRAFREDFDKYAKTKDEPSHFNLEGYMSARLIVEAIRKTRDPSPQGVIRGLEQMHEFDMGGYIVDFSPVKHTGSTWVDLSMISRNGTLIY